MGGSTEHGLRATGFRPAARQVDELIQRASHHPLGTDFLRDGALDAAAAVFGVHAFTIEAARAKLAGAPEESKAVPAFEAQPAAAR